MHYVGHVIRPPGEADSLILQVTFGCSYGSCRFCGAYPQAFGIKPLDVVFEDIEWWRRTHGPDVRRLFLADGNALVRSDDDLIAILTEAHRQFPDLRRIASYANARDILRRSPSSLARLADMGLTLLYLGLESGDDQLLSAMTKDHTAAEMIEAVSLAQSVGMKASVMALLGLAGDNPSASTRHAEATAQAFNRMCPRFINLLTLIVIPGTPLARDVASGSFRSASDHLVLNELRCLVDNLRVPGAVFRANHASNPLPLAGRLPRDRERLLQIIDHARAGCLSLTPGYLRGL